jgi:class 3 adenylate cyclase
MRINRSVWKQLRAITLFLAAFFLLTAGVQYGYVRYQLQRSGKAQMKEWGDDLVNQIGRQDEWDLKKYDQIPPVTAQWVLIGDGKFTDVEESDFPTFIPGLIVTKAWQDDSIFRAPKSYDVAGTTCRLYGKKLQDGSLVVGYYDFDSPQEKIDQRLQTAVGEFGPSTTTALRVRIRNTDMDLNWAVFDSWGVLLYQSGLLPFQSKSSVPPADGFSTYRGNGKNYLILTRVLNHPSGLLIIPFDMSYVAQALASQRDFGLTLALASFLCFLIISTRHLDRTESRRELLERTFEKYVSTSVLAEILGDPSNIHLGGEGKAVTVFFSDIRGFTPIAETMDPQALVALLNRYFEVMSEEIVKTGGTIDKYIGDAIMAFWGAPIEDAEQAEHAVQASLTMLQKLKELNKELAADGHPEIAIRIGLHTGRAIVGNVGSTRRFDYTAIGDTVNAASRMEGLNKEHGTQIIISDMVRNLLRDKTKWRPLGPVTVKGKSEPINIYTLA